MSVGSDPVARTAACTAAPAETISSSYGTVTGRPANVASILAVGRGAGSAAQQDQPASPSGHAGGLEGVESFQQAAHHPLEGGPGQEFAAHVGPDPLQGPGRIGPVRGAFPGQIGHEYQAVAPRGSSEGQIVESGVVHGE